MTAFRAKPAIGIFALATLLAAAASAQTFPAADEASSGRDASFLPAAPPAPLPVQVPPPQPVTLGAPVEAAGELQSIDPESIGLISDSDGGLGASFWKGAPRELVERLLPALALPGPSPALNRLARRFLLTTATVPEGAAGAGQNFAAMRIDRLIALGDAEDAWKLALLAKPGLVDEITLRLAAEAALASDNKEVCAKLPEIMQTHTSAEWQKSLVVCQLRAGDTKSAQLALDVLHAQEIKDDVFYALAEHNILGNAKTLPRQLTPLKPLTLALLELTGQPLPSELYARPDAVLVPALLQSKPQSGTNTMIELAERAGTRGIVSRAQLAEIYKSLAGVAGALNGSTPAIGRALLVQNAAQEKEPQKQLDDAAKFIQGLSAADLNGAMGEVAAGMIADVPPSPAYASYAPMTLKLLALAGKSEAALGWLKLMRQSPDATAQIGNLWPLLALSGLESQSDYEKDFGPWLTASLKDADRPRRELAGNLLLLLDADGFAVPDRAFAQTADPPAADRRTILPPALLVERLRAAGDGEKRGEAVLLGLMLANAPETPFASTVETVRALRLTGLVDDASALAREAAALLLSPPAAAKP